jgi:hypothetical protein
MAVVVISRQDTVGQEADFVHEGNLLSSHRLCLVRWKEWVTGSSILNSVSICIMITLLG